MSQTTSSSGTSALNIYLRLLTYLKPYKLTFALGIIGFVAYAASNYAFLEVLKNLLTVLEKNDPVDRYLIPLAIIATTIVRSVGAFMGSYYLGKVANGIVHAMRVQVFNHMTTLPTKIFDQRNSGHLISVITYNINGVASAATDAMKISLREGATVIGMLIYLFYKDWQLTLVFMVVAPLIGWLVSSVGKRLRRLSNKVQTSVGDITQVSGEMVNGYKVMRTFGGEQYEQQRFDEASKRNYAQNMKIVMTSAANTPVIQMLVAFAMAALIFVAMNVTKMREPAEFVTYISAVALVIQPMRRLGEVTPMILKGVAAADSVFQLLDEPSEQDQGSYEVVRAKGEVTFEHVQFSYAEQDVAALKDISLKVLPGEVVALVGRSGSGKSTLVNLLPRFYDVDNGVIAIDGVPINDYKLTNLREQIAFVNQQVTLFEGSVADNIAYGRADKVSIDQIKRAADLAYATEFIEQLPQGFDTQIGEGGARLSGGQRQRLAIARAILKDSPILILDEATSALDNESERYIQAAMEQVMKGRTTFVIAHRLSTIEHADRIVVMENGRIVEEGSHKELLERNGAYTKLHAAQFHGEMGSPASL
ncbi:lipid A export ATP-binding/permease protein MsbA [Cellvibrio zantedeschiae]|uniref:Lipid A export ATP-binding/permease protein MsbA n=1 Tax=Cellvibrio zantedeschiae TaxID=1237077 RepID=A0ABQ3B4A8_9GAMM|nr:lipid A export permease/ATP-binding protein MsbA [Cellvibrio zantedeschiae]GGY78667.1 lipid A export ATP-binding/permease protein MsbA [Cellvibrio zantedeschiae]